MAKLVYTAIGSLDGYLEDATGHFDWAAPDQEVHGFVNEAERSIGTYLYGRRLYETMVYWETAGTGPDRPPVVRDYATIWRAADKIVFSRTLTAPSSARTRVEPEFTPALVTALKDAAERDLSVGGAQLGDQALQAGLVDEVQLLLHPVTVGGGKPILPGGVRLGLLGQRTFRSGVVYLHYAVRT